MEQGKARILWGLFYVFLKAGTITFAGGLAMLPVIERDVVERYKLMTRDEFMEYATLSQTLPGVIAVNCASFVGRRALGTVGMLIASLGAILPAFALMVVATSLVLLIDRQGMVAGAFHGIRAASAALILSAAFSLGRHNLKSVFAVCVTVICFALIFFLDAPAPAVLLGAGAAGVAYGWIKQKKKGSAAR